MKTKPKQRLLYFIPTSRFFLQVPLAAILSHCLLSSKNLICLTYCLSRKLALAPEVNFKTEILSIKGNLVIISSSSSQSFMHIRTTKV